MRQSVRKVHKIFWNADRLHQLILIIKPFLIREQLCRPFLHRLQTQNLLAIGSPLRVDHEKHAYHVRQILRKLVRNFRVVPPDNLLVQPLHVIRSKGWFECDHLVENTAQRPNVTFDVVWLIPPNLRASVVGRPGLGVVQAFLVSNFGHIHVSKQRLVVRGEKNVGTFEVSMHDAQVVKRLQPLDHLDEHFPNLLLVEVVARLLVLNDFLKEVTVVGVLHDNAEGLGLRVNEGFLV